MEDIKEYIQQVLQQQKQEFENDLNNTINSFNDLYSKNSVRIGVSPRIDDRNIITDLEQMYYASKKDGYIMFASTLYYDDLFKNILTYNHNQDYLNNLVDKEKAKEAFKVCEEKVLAHGLDMKLIEAQYSFDGSKIIFFCQIHNFLIASVCQI